MSPRTRSSLASSRGQPMVSGLVAPRADARRRRRPMRVLPPDDRVAKEADALELGLHHVAGLEVEAHPLLLRLEAGHPRTRAGREHVAGGVSERREPRKDLRNGHAHPARVRLLPRLSVDAQLHLQVVRIWDLVGCDDPGPQRAEGVDRLAEAEDAGAHLAALDVARGDVVEDDVPADVVLGLLGREPLPRFSQHHGELELVVELLRQVLGIHHGLLRAHDRVDVLEEVDPGRNPVRPVNVARLLLVLAEVTGGVEELLRADGRTQPSLGQRRALVGFFGTAPLEVLAHGADFETHHLLTVDTPHSPLVVGHELHPQTVLATRAYTSAVFTRPSISRLSPWPGSMRPVEVP